MRWIMTVLLLTVFLFALGCETSGKSTEGQDAEPSGLQYGDSETDTEGPDDGTDTESDTVPGFNPGIEWQRIVGGTFEMGSPLDETDHQPNEQLHTVTLTHDFEMAATEITVGQWRALGFDWPHEIYLFFCDREDCPFFSDNDLSIEEWLDTLSDMNGLERCYADGPFETPYHCTGYRLPTEAEWEYAARGGTNTTTYAGDFSDTTVREVLGPIAYCAGGARTTEPVGSRVPNALGLYDMLGNVAEWTEWSGIYPSGAVTNPFHRSHDGRLYTNRGGAVDDLLNCRAAYRGEGHTQLSSPEVDDAEYVGAVGFRPVRTLPGTPLAPGPAETSTCPEPVNYRCEQYGDDATASLLSADDIADDIKFIAMAGGYLHNRVAIAGMRGTEDAETSVLAVVDVETADFEMYEYLGPEVGVRPVTPLVWYPPSSSDAALVAVLCTDDRCFLARPVSSDDAHVLEPIPGGALPTGFVVRAAAATQNRLFAVGSGVAVYDGEAWTTVISPGSGASFNEVSGADDTAVAVGDNGRLVVIAEQQPQEIQTGLSEDLLAVDTSPQWDGRLFFDAVGENGTVVEGIVSVDGTVTQKHCRIFDDPLHHVSFGTHYDNSRYYFGADGAHIYRGFEPWGIPACLAAPLPAPIVDVDLSAGFICQHYLTENGLYGIHTPTSPP